MDTSDVMDSNDADWYREEVGEEPDPGKLWLLTCDNIPCARITDLNFKKNQMNVPS